MEKSGQATGAGLRKAVAYLGPGEDARADGSLSLQRQAEEVRAFCDQSGLLLCGVFPPIDGPAAGDAYEEMVDCIRAAGEAVTVVAPSLEVFGPRHEDVATAVLDLEELGAQVRLLNGTVIDPMGVAMGTWPQAAAPSPVRERIKSAMRHRAIRGEGLGKPPYGYTIGRSRKLEILPEEADTVRLIFSLYTQRNMGIRLIVRHLNEHGIPTRKGRNWSMVTVRDILRNRAYVGTYTRFGMRVPGSHPAIVSRDMFRWAEMRLDQRRPKRRNGQAEPFLLSGLIYCGYCGNRMVGVTRKQKWTRRRDGSEAERQYRYYQCQSRTNQSVCEYHTRRARELELAVLEHLKSQRGRLAALKGSRSLAASRQALARDRERLLTTRRNVERRLRQAIQRAAAGALSQLEFRALGSQLIRARRQLTDQLRDLDRRSREETDHLTPGQRAATHVDRLAAEWETLDLPAKRGLVQELVERVTVFDHAVDIKLRLL